MTYRYYTSGSPNTFESPKVQILTGFQAQINEYFEEAPSAYVIQEETAIGSGIYANVDVRVNKAISSRTGISLGDDYKILIFKDLAHSSQLGTRYYFDDPSGDYNYWLTFNSEIIKNFAGSATIRRCNNTLRWIDSNGVTYSEPCIIEYQVNAPKDYLRVEPVRPDGSITVYAQLNNNSKQIRPNQRFLFGNVDNWTAFKIYGDGVRNFLNYTTLDNTSAPLLRLEMGANFEGRDNDDLVNGIADANQFVYDLAINPTSINGNPGDHVQLIPTVTLNDIVVNTKTVSYITTGSAIATLTSNIVNLIASGSCNIDCSLTDNSLIHVHVPVTVTSTPVNYYEVRVIPNDDIILQGDTVAFEVYLYLGGVVQADTFTFSLDNANVPTDNYTFTVLDGHNFTISNILLYLENSLDINCVSGSNTRKLELWLRGSW